MATLGVCEQQGLAHTQPHSSFPNSFPALQEEASSPLPCCQLVFFFSFVSIENPNSPK